MPMGAIPRLFMAVAQAFGSDMGIPSELESIAIFLRLSIQKEKKEKRRIYNTLIFHFLCIAKIMNTFQNCRLNKTSSQYQILLWESHTALCIGS